MQISFRTAKPYDVDEACPLIYRATPEAFDYMFARKGRALKEKFQFLRERYYGAPGIWSAGYFVSTVGLDEHMIRRYVRHQEKEDLGQAKFSFS